MSSDRKQHNPSYKTKQNHFHALWLIHLNLTTMFSCLIDFFPTFAHFFKKSFFKRKYTSLYCYVRTRKFHRRFRQCQKCLALMKDALKPYTRSKKKLYRRCI